MRGNTKIYHRFTGYSMEDCECRYCLYFDSRRRTCTLRKCCCLEERIQAALRESSTEIKDRLLWALALSPFDTE